MKKTGLLADIWLIPNILLHFVYSSSGYKSSGIEKYLGMLVANLLTFTYEAVSNTNRLLVVICCTYQYLDKTTFLHLCMENIFPLLELGLVVFRFGGLLCAVSFNKYQYDGFWNINEHYGGCAKKCTMDDVDVWHLPETTVTAPPVNALKKRLNKVWMNQAVICTGSSHTHVAALLLSFSLTRMS